MSDAVVALLIVLCFLGVTLSVVHQHRLAVTKECINNLRLIDGAKETWAFLTYSETNHSVTLASSSMDRRWEVCFSKTTPAAKEIVRYINDYTEQGYIMPQCPQGGIYTIGRIGDLPTCSIPGHTLPQ